MRHFILSLIFVCLAVFGVQAEVNIPEPMKPYRMVNDFAKVFPADERDDIENMLRQYHNNTTTQIYVVTVNSLDGEAPYFYAQQLGEKWGIGQKGKDNGVLILIKPKTANEKGEVYIAAGYGLEAELNDAYCGRIIDNYMMPYLRENNYYQAAKNGSVAVMKRLSGDNITTEAIKQKPATDDDREIGLLAKILIPIFIILFIVSPKFRWLVLLLIMRGGGGGGSRGGGGFGGGGGGRFGGGGAGRSW